MAQTSTHQSKSDLDSKCSKAQPWVRRFVEEYQQDGRPWGYATFEDPTIDEEVMEECQCRLSMLLNEAKDAVFGRSHYEFPRFKFEHLEWPEDSDDGSDMAVEDAAEEPENVEAGRSDQNKADEAEEDEDDEEVDDNASIDIDDDGSESHGSHKEDLPDAPEVPSDDSEDDADIETVRELPKLRAHFKWVRERKKLVKDYLDIDRSGIPTGLLRNVFLVLDQDSVNSIVNNSPRADFAWIWAIDPDYEGDVAEMTENGLDKEYYGYMRVRLQQLVKHFWVVRKYHEDEFSLQMLWGAAKESHDCAFVSLDPKEARMWSGDTNLGSALRAKA